jgi:hypothetical protein
MPSVIHFVDVARIKIELRPVCGDWSEEVTWTTVRSAVTCLACTRLLSVAPPAGMAAGPRRRRRLL